METVHAIKEVIAFQQHFETSLQQQLRDLQDKLYPHMEALEALPEYLQTRTQYLPGTKGLYEVRIPLGIQHWFGFCFIQSQKLTILYSDFLEKKQKRSLLPLRKVVILMQKCLQTQHSMTASTSWEDIKERVYGPKHGPRRAKLDRDVASFLVGQRLKQARKELGFTQERLAQILQKKRSYISRLENDGGNMTLKTLHDLVHTGLGGKVLVSIEI